MKIDPRALPSTDDIQRTLFQTLQEKRKVIIGMAFVAAAVVVAVIVYVNSVEARRTSSLAAIYNATQSRDLPQGVLDLEAEIERAPDDLKAYALLKLGESCFKAAQDPSLPDEEALDYLDRGLEALRRIERDHPDDPWALEASVQDPNLTLVRSLMRKMTSDRKWREEHVYRHPEVNSDRTALIETNRGNIRIGFFTELAPGHVENFIKLAKTGFFNGTLVHGAYGGYWIKLGDPNTRDRMNRKTHGKGGPGYSLDPEPARYRVRHLPGVVSTEYLNGQESGSQFMISVTVNEAYDKEQTPFGEVLEGLDVAESISHVETVARDRSILDSDRTGLSPHLPTSLIIVHAISIWRGGKIDEGHEWDTSSVGTEWPAEEPVDPDSKDDDVSPDVARKLEAMWDEARTLESAGKLEEALARVLEIIVLDPAYPGAIDKAAELRVKTDR